MEYYINNFNNFNKIIIYNFKIRHGGIGDFLKYFMIILTECIKKNIRVYRKINNIEIEKYIKFKYDFFNINSDKISKLKNVTIKEPGNYYGKEYKGNLCLNEVFYFDKSIKMNIQNILPKLPVNYISIHLRLGDKYLETKKKFIHCKNDVRTFSQKKIYKFIEENSDKIIIFFCDNKKKKLEIKNKYKNVIITNAEIGHTSYPSTKNKEVLDTITEFYILSNSQLIYAASHSGFSEMASKFNNNKYIK